MFEDTLLIIKPDYMAYRKALLLKLIEKGFQILTNRKLLFSPETAAEFLKESVEERAFMFQVILLTKGPCEVFLLTKRNAIDELVGHMLCYFLTSVEMERRVHVSSCAAHAKREISFIFPNYLHEPIPPLEPKQFIKQPVLEPVLERLHEIYKAGTQSRKHWKPELVKWLHTSNYALPIVTPACAGAPIKHDWEKVTEEHHKEPEHDLSEQASTSSSGLSGHTTPIITSSSCISCSCFDGTDSCMKLTRKDECLLNLVAARTEKVWSSSSLSQEQSYEEEPPKQEQLLEVLQDADWAKIPSDDLMGFDGEDEGGYMSERVDLSPFAFIESEDVSREHSPFSGVSNGPYDGYVSGEMLGERPMYELGGEGEVYEEGLMHEVEVYEGEFTDDVTTPVKEVDAPVLVESTDSMLIDTTLDEDIRVEAAGVEEDMAVGEGTAVEEATADVSGTAVEEPISGEAYAVAEEYEGEDD